MILITTFLLVSCYENLKNDYVLNFESFLKETEEHYESFNQDDWEKADTRFELYSNIKYNKYRNSLSHAQNSKVNKLIGKYQALKVKANIRSASKTVGDILEQVSSVVSEIVNDTTLIK